MPAICRPLGLACSLLVLLTLATPTAAAKRAATGPPEKKQDELPSFAQVTRAVQARFKASSDYRPGDLVTRGDVAKALARLADIGWEVADAAAIAGQFPGDGEFVVQQLRTRDGRRFMQKVGGMPGGYDRLFRLAQLSDGRQLIRKMVRVKGGSELVGYLTESRGGENLGQMLSRTPDGKDFNKPTGMLFTELDLLKQLAKHYQAATAAQKK